MNSVRSSNLTVDTIQVRLTGGRYLQPALLLGPNGGEAGQPNQDGRLDLGAVYSDKLVKSDILNVLILFLNMNYGHSYRNILNLTLQSQSTHLAQQNYHRLTEGEDHQDPDKGKGEQLRKKSLIDDSCAPLSSYNPEKIGLTGRFAPKLGLPKGNKFLIGFVRLGQFILLVRYLLMIWELSPSHRSRVTLTSTRGLWGVDPEGLEEPHRFIMKNLSMSQRDLEDSYTTDCDISQRLVEKLVSHRYRQFEVRNISLGLGGKFVTDYIFLEQHETMQILIAEVRTTVYLLACFLLFCGLILGVLFSHKQLNVTVVAFMFEPKFIAINTHARVVRYVDMIRGSYVNFWSAYELSSDGALLVRNKAVEIESEGISQMLKDDAARASHLCRRVRPSGSPTATCRYCKGKAYALTRELKQSDESVVDAVSLNRNQFDGYIPRARSQAWRRVLLILHPTLHGVVSLCVFSIIAWLFLWSTYSLNGTVTRLNLELRSVVSGDTLGVPAGLPIPFRCQDSQEHRMKITDQFRGIIKRILWAHLSDSNPSLATNTTAFSQATAFPNNLMEQIMQSEPEKLQDKILIHAFAPTEDLSLINWAIVLVSMSHIVSLISLYSVVYTICVMDICFWLVELRLKLDICVHILKHYHSFATRDRRSQLIDGELAICEPIEELEIADSHGLENCSPAARHKADLPVGRLIINENNEGGERTAWRLISQPMTGKIATQNPPSFLKDGRFCNMSLRLCALYLVSSRSARGKMASDYAKKLVDLDLSESVSPRRTTDKFLTSTYLDFRIFQDEIDDCRQIINTIIFVVVLNAMNFIGGSMAFENIKVQRGIVLTAFIVTNATLIVASVFQSQCSKLHNPIYSILAASLMGNKRVKHLASLWRRTLIDLTGSRSKFAFRFYSLTVSYATTLQFNLSIASLFLLTLDRSR